MNDDIEFRSIDEIPTSEWTAFVERHPSATVFHSLGWLQAVETTFGYEPRSRLAFNESGEIVAAVPGVRVRDGFGHSVINPFCEYGYPLVGDSVAGKQVLSALRSTVGPLGSVVVKDVEWSGVEGYFEATYGGVRTGTSQRLHLDRTFEEMWESTFKQQIRQRVRTARDHDVQVDEGSLQEFYRLYLATMNRLGSPQFPLEFFEELDDRSENVVTVLIARVSGRPIGALFTMEWRETTYIWGNGSIEDGLRHRPNHLLYATAIERACNRGHSVVDFGRSRRGTGVHEFKAQFGGTDHRLVSFVAPPHRSSRASLEGYGRLAPITRRLAPIITHPLVGPRLKAMIHE